MSYGVIGTSPGSLDVPRPENAETRLHFAELILRVVVLVLAVVSAALIASASQVKLIFSISKEAKFTSIKTLVFLVVIDGIVATYSLVQLVRCVAGIVRGSGVIFSKPVAWLIFSADQVTAYLSMAAVAAAAQSAVISKVGQRELQWMKVCDMYAKFCSQVGEGIATCVGVTLCTVILSCMSAYSLFRLYGWNHNINRNTTVSAR